MSQAIYNRSVATLLALAFVAVITITGVSAAEPTTPPKRTSLEQLDASIGEWGRAFWIWRTCHYVFGFAGIGITAYIAATASEQTPGNRKRVVLSVSAAICTGVLMMSQAEAKALAYGRAKNILTIEREKFRDGQVEKPELMETWERLQTLIEDAAVPIRID